MFDSNCIVQPKLTFTASSYVPVIGMAYDVSGNVYAINCSLPYSNLRSFLVAI